MPKMLGSSDQLALSTVGAMYVYYYYYLSLHKTFFIDTIYLTLFIFK